MNKTALRQSLVDLGVARPDLRPSIRPLLAALGQKVAADLPSSEDLAASAVQALSKLKGGRYRIRVRKLKSDKGSKGLPSVTSAEVVYDDRMGEFRWVFAVTLTLTEDGFRAVVISDGADFGEETITEDVFTKWGSNKPFDVMKDVIERAVGRIMSRELSYV